jgi:hypothetical protein
MCDWRKLPRRVTSRPEIEISDKRLAFSTQTSSIEPSYKTGPKQVKMSISPIAQGFLKKFRVQHVALTARRPNHPSLVWCTQIFLYETFSRLIPRDSNKGHHSLFQLRWCEYCRFSWPNLTHATPFLLSWPPGTLMIPWAGVGLRTRPSSPGLRTKTCQLVECGAHPRRLCGRNHLGLRSRPSATNWRSDPGLSNPA